MMISLGDSLPDDFGRVFHGVDPVTDVGAMGGSHSNVSIGLSGRLDIGSRKEYGCPGGKNRLGGLIERDLSR